jgi:hypothetical protein
MSITAKQEEEVEALVAAATEILNEDRRFIQITACTNPDYDNSEPPLHRPWEVHLFALDASGRVYWNNFYRTFGTYEWAGWEAVEDDRNC